MLPGLRKETRLVFEVYEEGGLVERAEETSVVGIVDRAEVRRVLDAAGFDVRAEWGGYDFTSYRDGGSLLVVEAVA
ncbi:MAG: hypothetical protein KAW67_09570 [Candidatus Eisenbacteria sp.]|nr:hypothetical protein [Candidatus Eisenbacteria bacterium]